MQRNINRTHPTHRLRRHLLLGVAGAAMFPVWADVLRTGQHVEWPTIALLDGELLPPRHWRDRAAVLVFFSTTCPFCVRHNQQVQRLHEAARGRPLQVLGAAVGEEGAAVRDYLQKRGLSFPVTLQGKALRARFSSRQVIPLTVVIDRGGVLREVIPGEMFDEDVLGLLRYA